MFANVVRLEFSKQRKVFLSGLLLAIVVLFFIFAESTIRNRNFLETFRDIIGYLALIGIAGLVILMGPIAGSQLRTESIRSAEEPLPFSPTQKVFGAYLTSLFYVLIGCIFFFAIVAVLKSFLDLYSTLSLIIDQQSVDLKIILLLVLQFHLLAFVFAYWINQAVAGTAVAAVIVGSEVGILLLIRILRDVFWFSYKESSWLIIILCGVILGLIGAIAGLAILGKRVERSSRMFFLPGLVVTIAAFAGSFFLFSTFCFTSYKFQNRLVPANLSWPNRLIESPRVESRQAFFLTMSGDLVQMTPEKKIVLRNTSFKLNPNTNMGILAQYSAGESSFFLIEKEFGKYEIWKASDEKFENYISFSSPKIPPEFMFRCDDSTCLYSYAKNQNFIVFSKIPLGFKQNENIEWQRIAIANDSYGFSTMLENALKSQLEKGQAAKLSDSKKILKRFLPDGKTLEWHLPGTAVTKKYLGSMILPAYKKNGEPYFVIPVTANHKTSFVQCLPDGSIKPAWNDSWPYGAEVTPRSLEGGMVWTRDTEVRAVTIDGTFYGSMKIPADSFNSWPIPMKMDGPELWVIFGTKLMKIDLMNKRVLVKYSPLPDRPNYWDSYFLNSTKEGMYFVRDNQIGLIDWNGKIRDLGSATVN